ncbi:DUF4031 domain-containing protein [Saxibacter everestensis]|uniref:DUF4031 domain-containing protein n=1 Tax=Saxibacter everestensis TaxID=2909229 RepID=UPI0032E36670
MAIFVDAPIWPAHGRRWAHLICDTGFAELHAFAASQEIPARAFDGDHYDVPAESISRLLSAGATQVSTRDMVRILRDSKLRSMRPRSAKPGYASRRIAVGAGIVLAAAQGAGQQPPERAALSELGFAALAVGKSLGDVVARAESSRPALDSVVVVGAFEPAPALAQLQAVSSDFRLADGGFASLDGRTRLRHRDGAEIIGRVHWPALRE